ncbi:GNAT family N-acetyltransferase [Paenibacillus sp. sptzw28]|uniref:GNAT family N-acetyltransferase n=1 Tax=Paenibacillus sp. sptzw28 TaxID=715179 RepID=UPI001C6E74FB|nr:GNAT family N-acetyltransferase [Paenibacillus sp. sptzw28]QYR21987.1 GNAT family N-acetyltransferase [Paenibacillus sp. sptzw28]
MEQASRIIALLEEDRLGNITLLKMIETYGDAMTSYLIQAADNGALGILLLLPVEACPYDQQTYPDMDYVVFMDYTSDEIFPKLIEHIPAAENLVFKLHRENSKRRLAQLFPLENARTFYSYTAPSGVEFSYDGDVVISGSLDERLLPLWLNNGYIREEIEHYFKNGAFAFAVFQEGIPVSATLAFKNYKDIWEVGAVHTLEAWRGRGYGKKVVCAALQHIINRGLTPRYHVLEANLASVRLAESIGLTPFMKLEHLLVSLPEQGGR